MPEKKKTKSPVSQTSYFSYPKEPLKFSLDEKGEMTIRFLTGPSSKEKNKVLIKEFPYFKAAGGDIIKSEKIWYAGLGPIEELDYNSFGSSVLAAAKACAKCFESVVIDFDEISLKKIGPERVARLTIAAFGVSVYPVDLLKSEPEAKSIKLKKVGIRGGQYKDSWKKELSENEKIPRHINAMRQLQSLPGNIANPEGVEKRARAMAKEFGLKIKVFQKSDLEKMGAGGIISVGKGSEVPPRMIILEYKPSGKNLKKLALVGKGVTFDSGGISIKPSPDMHEMKFDMSGASSVLHSLAAISQVKLKVHVVAAIGLAENLPDGSAIKPGDVYTAYNGKTIEVQNTDAEGRLILGDLLSYVGKNYKPDYMVNLATLTGACMVALGSFYAGLFTQNDKIKELVLKASEDSMEPVWPMPMGPLYKAQLKSDIADFNNIGDRWGGASSAASFLSIFVEESIPWAHLDIAGVAYMKKGFNVYPTIPTGYGVRLLVDLARKLQ